MAKSNKQRQKQFKEKLNNDPERLQEYKEKRAKESKDLRSNMKGIRLERQRELSRLRNIKQREKKRQEKKHNDMLAAGNQLSPFSNNSAKMKALNRTSKALPKNTSKGK